MPPVRPLPKPYLRHLKNHFTYNPKTGRILKDGQPCVRRVGATPCAIWVHPPGKRGRYVSAPRVAWFLAHGDWCRARFDLKSADLRLDSLAFYAGQPRASGKKQAAPTYSKYKGVSFKPGRERPWVSRIKHDGFLYFLGHFPTEEEAALAYNDKATELLGAQAVLNDVA